MAAATTINPDGLPAGGFRFDGAGRRAGARRELADGFDEDLEEPRRAEPPDFPPERFEVDVRVAMDAA